jgi:hypothetical protein
VTLNVFLLWLVVLVIAVVSSIILSNIPFIGQLISMAVSVIVIQPLSVIWWSRLYLSGIGIESPLPNFKPIYCSFSILSAYITFSVYAKFRSNFGEQS